MNKPEHWSDERWQAWQNREKAMVALRMHDQKSIEAQRDRDAERKKLIDNLVVMETALATFAREDSNGSTS